MHNKYFNKNFCYKTNIKRDKKREREKEILII